MGSCLPISLFAWQTDVNVKVILISEFTNSEIEITSTFRYFCQANRISFRKTSYVDFFLDTLHELTAVFKVTFSSASLRRTLIKSQVKH